MTERAVGPILDELGVTIELAEHDRVSEVLVITKVTNLEDGAVALVIASNDLDWIAQAGLHAAYAQVTAAPQRRNLDE